MDLFDRRLPSRIRRRRVGKGLTSYAPTRIGGRVAIVTVCRGRAEGAETRPAPGSSFRGERIYCQREGSLIMFNIKISALIKYNIFRRSRGADIFVNAIVELTDDKVHKSEVCYFASFSISVKRSSSNLFAWRDAISKSWCEIRDRK